MLNTQKSKKRVTNRKLLRSFSLSLTLFSLALWNSYYYLTIIIKSLHYCDWKFFSRALVFSRIIIFDWLWHMTRATTYILIIGVDEKLKKIDLLMEGKVNWPVAELASNYENFKWKIFKSKKVFWECFLINSPTGVSHISVLSSVTLNKLMHFIWFFCLSILLYMFSCNFIVLWLL